MTAISACCVVFRASTKLEIQVAIAVVSVLDKRGFRPLVGRRAASRWRAVAGGRHTRPDRGPKEAGQRLVLEKRIRGFAVVVDVRLPCAHSRSFAGYALRASDGIEDLAEAMARRSSLLQRRVWPDLAQRGTRQTCPRACWAGMPSIVEARSLNGCAENRKLDAPPYRRRNAVPFRESEYRVPCIEGRENRRARVVHENLELGDVDLNRMAGDAGVGERIWAHLGSGPACLSAR